MRLVWVLTFNTPPPAGWLTPGCHVSPASMMFNDLPGCMLVDSLYPSLCLPNIAFQANKGIEKLNLGSHLHQPYPYSQLLAETIIKARGKIPSSLSFTFNTPPPAGWLTPGCHVSHDFLCSMTSQVAKLVDSTFTHLCAFQTLLSKLIKNRETQIPSTSAISL